MEARVAMEKNDGEVEPNTLEISLPDFDMAEENTFGIQGKRTTENGSSIFDRVEDVTSLPTDVNLRVSGARVLLKEKASLHGEFPMLQSRWRDVSFAFLTISIAPQ